MKLYFSVLLVCLALFSCKSAPLVQNFDRPVKLYNVESLGYINKSYAAVVESAEQTSLAFQMGGEIIKLTVEAGDVVRKGQFIASVDPIDYSLQVDAAKAQYVTAEAEVERYKRLLEKDAVSQQQYEAARATYVSRKSAYENSLQTLQNTQIYAPFTGIVERKFVDNYQRVQPAAPVIKIINPDSLEVTFTISTSDAKLIASPLVEYSVEFDNYPGLKFKAKLKRYIDVSVDGEGFPMIVSITDPTFSPKSYDIKAGYTCSVLARIDNPMANDIVAVPLTAIYASKSGNDSSVWIYDEKSATVNLKSVELGELFSSDMVAVKSGLSLGEKVVIGGIYQLSEGQKVEVLK
ncbi:MAG: efflux RND transporter periplasmic adaptor subunit [Rikenellaceae bacterium]